ncbi:hypothetical protein [Aurantiacibacter odishensis]|uniref:hypothetical protein n=1 Tax=Aurantiacibacter odishensis TaxID=1155476 RepID=UPI000E75ECBE|nr:hypothetical protein [Aurantiacibacter odishensis]
MQTALARGRIEDLGRKALESLVANWWAGREAFREPDWSEEQTVNEAKASIEEEANLVARAEGEASGSQGQLALFD